MTQSINNKDSNPWYDESTGQTSSQDKSSEGDADSIDKSERKS